MITQVGMTDVAGLMVLEKRQNLFLTGGQSLKDYSEDMAIKIDTFTKELLNERYNAVKERLQTYSGAIENMVKALYEKETIEGEKVREIIAEFEKENDLPSRLTRKGANDGENGEN